MDTWIWNQVGLELVEIDVQSTIETDRSGDRRDNLSNQAVKMLVRRTWDIEVSPANIVDGLIVDEEGTVGVLNGTMGSKDGVVRLNDGSRDTRSWVDGKLQLALLAVVEGETLQEESTKTGTSSTTERVEKQETLKTRAGIGYLADLVDNAVNELLSDSVVTTSVVVGGILLSANQKLRVEKRSVLTSSDLVNWRWVQINENRPWNVFSGASFSEECFQAAYILSNSVWVWLSIGEETVFQQVKLPSTVTQLSTSLTNVDVQDLSSSHCVFVLLFLSIRFGPQL